MQNLPFDSKYALGLKFVRRPTNGTCVVFAHGILSDGQSAWGSPTWPELLASEMPGIGVCSFTYYTAPNSGAYSMRDAADMLGALFDVENLWEVPNLILIGHSMGGIILRKFLVVNEGRLSRTKIGLVLVASPSRGSWLASRLKLMLWAIGQSQALDLADSGLNTWLSDLHSEFRGLIPRLGIQGRELVEGQPIKQLKWLGIFRRIVEPCSAAVYFRFPLTIPLSDHWSIAKPQSRDAIQYRVVARFIQDFQNYPANVPLLETHERLAEGAGHAVKGISSKFSDVATWSEAMGAVQEALIETRSYVAHRRNGARRNAVVEHRLSRIWGDASIGVSQYDPELGAICLVKGEGWADPRQWENKRFKNARKDLDDVTERLIRAMAQRLPSTS